MAPWIVHRDQKTVGPRTTASSYDGLHWIGIDERLDPEGEFDVDNPVLGDIAKEMGIPRDDVVNKIRALQVGDEIDFNPERYT